MAAIAWLHLSDWHQKGADFDRKVVRDGLLKCIEGRADVDSALADLNFVVFSGDVAFQGRTEEYLTAKREFFEPLLSTLKLDPKFLFVIPGNHDLDRQIVSDMLPLVCRRRPKIRTKSTNGSPMKSVARALWSLLKPSANLFEILRVRKTQPMPRSVISMSMGSR